MYIVAIAWMYVALMMAVAEATNTNGTVLGAIVTFILYGLMPISLVVYLMRSPGRKRAIKEKEAQEAQLLQPNAASHPPAAAELDSIAPVREKS
jgi:mannose/fructose/N-acetylgalactosamine-specific phosphotransferase system component IID